MVAKNRIVNLLEWATHNPVAPNGLSRNLLWYINLKFELRLEMRGLSVNYHKTAS